MLRSNHSKPKIRNDERAEMMMWCVWLLYAVRIFFFCSFSGTCVFTRSHICLIRCLLSDLLNLREAIVEIALQRELRVDCERRCECGEHTQDLARTYRLIMWWEGNKRDQSYCWSISLVSLAILSVAVVVSIVGNCHPYTILKWLQYPRACYKKHHLKLSPKLFCPRG